APHPAPAIGVARPHRLLEPLARQLLEPLAHLISPRWIGRAGTPTTVAPAGTSRVTTAPAPTTASAPTRIRGRTVAPAQIQPLTSTRTSPQSVAPGATPTPSASTHSWSTLARVWTMHWRPSRAC